MFETKFLKLNRLIRELCMYDCLQCTSCGQIVSVEIEDLDDIMEKVNRTMKCCKEPDYLWVC